MVVAHRLLHITDILTATTSTLVFFHYCCYPRGLAEHLRLYLKVSRRVEVYLLSAIFVSRLSMLFFPLKHSLYTTSFLLFTCTRLLVTVLCDVFFFLLFRCIFCVVCKCTAWFAVVVRVVYSEYYYYGKNYYVCIITCRLTSCPKCVSVFFFSC